jgi:hypothetical protein
MTSLVFVIIFVHLILCSLIRYFDLQLNGTVLLLLTFQEFGLGCFLIYEITVLASKQPTTLTFLISENI